MIKEFFLDKFEYDYFATRNWIKVIVDQEDQVSPFVLKSISHILNVHHIWNSRLNGQESESELWDVFVVDHLYQLHDANYRETINFLEQNELDQKVHYHSSEGIKLEKNTIDILYHILNHSNYHRAQIVMDLKQNNLAHPSFNFITFR